MSQTGVLAPSGIVGYGFPEESFEAALRLRPDVIGCDGGSTDQGPGDLGRGTLHVSRDACERDLTLMMHGAQRLGIPLLLGTAGGAGAAPHVDAMHELIIDIARKAGWKCRLATIYSDLTKEYLHGRVDLDATASLDNGPVLMHGAIDACTSIVGVMGSEPYLQALEDGADVVLAGRSSDSAIFAAVPLLRDHDAGLAWHVGKLLECGAASAVPTVGGDCMMAWIGTSSFEVEPVNPALRCTPLSVAAHTMYENASPYLLYEPSGALDTTGTSFKAVSDRRVRVEGSRFRPTERYSVKIEGVKLSGYRTITIGIARDPVLVAHLDDYISHLEESVADTVRAVYASQTPPYRLSVQPIGGVASARRDLRFTQPGSAELGILLSVVAPTQALSDAILAITRTHALHAELPGRGGLLSNLAFPFAPTDIPTGPVHEFALNHLVFPDSWRDTAIIRMEQL